MMKWKKWAVDLEHDEKNLKATMPDHLKKILQPKKIRLWEKLLCEAGYQDMGVVSEMISGTSLVGETEASGLWPAKFTPARLTEDELLEISARDKWANLDRIASCPNPDKFGSRPWLREIRVGSWGLLGHRRFQTIALSVAGLGRAGPQNSLC